MCEGTNRRAITRSQRTGPAQSRESQRGTALPSRSADRGGDHPRPAPGRTRPVCRQDSWADRDPGRAGLRISEALALAETDLDGHRGALLIRAGKGGKRREVGMDRWGYSLDPWLELRANLPVGALFCGANRRRTRAAWAVLCSCIRMPAGAHGRPRVAPRRTLGAAVSLTGLEQIMQAQVVGRRCDLLEADSSATTPPVPSSWRAGTLRR